MGETEKEAKLVSFGRSKLNPETTSFTFRGRFKGTTMLHFYKNDILTGSYIDDYLEVIVEETETTSKEHLLAPSYAKAVPPEPNFALLKDHSKNAHSQDSIENAETIENNNSNNSNSNNRSFQNLNRNNSNNQSSSIAESKFQIDDGAQEKSGKTRIQTTTETDSSEKQISEVYEKSEQKKQVSAKAAESIQDTAPATIIEQAQKAYDNADYETALHLITDFFEASDIDLDKALFLQGQILEAKSPVQDIKSAIDAYDVIIKNYRQSSLWKKANERSIYLKRFYINIR